MTIFCFSWPIFKILLYLFLVALLKDKTILVSKSENNVIIIRCMFIILSIYIRTRFTSVMNFIHLYYYYNGYIICG